MKKLEEYVKSIPDFPEKGIIFRDVTSVLQDADGLHAKKRQVIWQECTVMTFIIIKLIMNWHIG